MAKRRKRKRKRAQQSADTPMMSERANLPRFFIMLAVGLVFLVFVLYAAMRNNPVVVPGATEAPAESAPAPNGAPAGP